MKIRQFKIYLFVFFIVVSYDSYSQVSVLTQHNDLNRTGWNNKETILTTKNVNRNSFGQIFSRQVDDQIFAQALVVLNANIPVKGNKNIVIVATVNNTIYAFDADSANVSNPYWQKNLTPIGSRPVKNTDMNVCGGYVDFSGKIGIVGTPVIDSSIHIMYLVARSLDTTSNIYSQYLHAIDITTGSEVSPGPILITAQVPGTGDGGTVVTFNPQKQNQRAGLLLLDNTIYIVWSSHCDWDPYHGWVMGYDKTTLQQKSIYNTTPNGGQGGIWMSAAAPAADEFGNIYVAAGNGDVDTFNNPVNLGQSAIKLTPTGSALTVSSFFTPQNYDYTNANDLDFGAPGMLLIPNTKQVLTGCKEGNLYLLNRDTMGGYSATSNDVLQTISVGSNGEFLRSSLAYYKGEQKEFIYNWSENLSLHAYPYDRVADTLDVTNAIVSDVQGPIGANGSFLSLSSNGSADSTAILWVNQAANGQDAEHAVRPGILRAFSATDVTKELWNSSQNAREDPGNYAKFVCPTVSNGKVYQATFSNKLMVYGLRYNAGDSCNSVNIALHKPCLASSQTVDVVNGVNVNRYADSAFDGNVFSRWASAGSDQQWIYVDLGARYDLCKVVLKWETALGKDFQIQVSEDALNWTTLDSVKGNIDYDNYLPLQGSGRYVRMNGIARGTTYGYSLWEFEVYGTLSSNQIVGSGDLCTGVTSANYKVTIAGTAYQWQLDNGSGYTDLTDNANYTGTKTANLQLNNLSSSWYGYKYRCKVDTVYSNPVTLTFSNTWTGAIDDSWENIGNWSCGRLPDANTDVYINSGTVIVNSSPTIRSINLKTGVHFTVNSNFIFTVNH
ncbi:MAG: discoidin domain-containing protein [Bacteroidota bacterium]|nr:discoidin domain-containing protein [Bacteroidota bacterium]